MKTREELKAALEELQGEANKIIGYMVALDDLEKPEEPEDTPEVEGGEDG